MCHLSIEKALKGFYYEKKKEIPPKVHNLVYLLNEIGQMPPEALGKYVVKLNEASITTRYPEDLSLLSAEYSEPITSDMLTRGKEVINWIRNQL